MAAILARAQRGEQTSQPKTEFLSRDEILAAQRREQSPDSKTKFLSRDEILATPQPRERHPSATEFLSREEMFAAVQHREPFEMPAATLESKHEPQPGPVSSGEPDIAAETLELHLGEAVDAMEKVLEALAGSDSSMPELAAGPERSWRGNVEVLSLTSKRVVEQMVLPALRNPNTPARRRLATALTLLEIKRVDVPTLVLDLFAELDTAGRTVLLDALAHWDDLRADKTVLAGLQRFAAAHRHEWLRLCVERSCELPAEVLGPLLEEKAPKLLAAGLRLIPFGASVDKYSSIVDRHLVAGLAEVREPAILTGLLLERPTALLVSKQAARDPSMPLVCEALASTGSDADSKALIPWTSKPNAPAHAGWALGLIGRLDALDACAARLDHADAAVVDSALAGLRHASGFEGPAEQARRWWTEHRDDFKPGVRYLAGQPISFEVVRKRLMTAPTQVRQALALELGLRSRGRIRLPLRRLPGAYVEAVARLDEALLVARF